MASQARAASGPLHAATRTVRKHDIRLSLPRGVDLALPSADQLAFYGGIGLLAALGVVEWPVATLLVVGHALAASRHSRMLQEFGQALEQA
jgi:hypothetical protein